MHIPRFLCLLSGLVFFGTSAFAATLSNQITLSNGDGATPGCGGFQVSNSGATTVSNIAPYSEPGCSVTLSGYSGGGVVGIFGRLSASPGSRSIMQATARAVSNISNIFIVPEAGKTVEELLDEYGQTISLTLNAELNASLDAIIESASPFSRGAGAGLDASVRMFATGGMQLDADSVSISVVNTPSGQSAGGPILRNINLTSTHDWLQPLGVAFELQGRATTSTFGDSLAGAEFSALNSLGFASDVPVFDLPEGFTIFSPELNIVDNRWTDPRTVVPPSTVPLPAGLPLLLVGLAALGLIHRRT